MSDAIESPCILVCSVDMETGFCHGCGRTTNEIGAWTLYPPERRRQIMDELPDRLRAITAEPPQESRQQRRARLRLDGQD